MRGHRPVASVSVAIELRPVRPAGWWWDAALLGGLAALTLALANGALLELDLAVRDWVRAHQPTAAHWTALVLNYLGQGGPLTATAALLAGALAHRTRSVRPLLVVVAALVLTFFTIGPLKVWLDRGFPRAQALAHPERLFSDPAGGLAYPSGHVANAVVWYGVITLLLGALLSAYNRTTLTPAAARALRVVPPAIVFCTTTYLAHHWVTDSVAGLLLGLLVDRLLARVPWDALPLPDRLGEWRAPAVSPR